MNTIVIEIQLLGREIKSEASNGFLFHFELGADKICDYLRQQGVQCKPLVYLASRNEPKKKKRKVAK